MEPGLLYNITTANSSELMTMEQIGQGLKYLMITATVLVNKLLGNHKHGPRGFTVACYISLWQVGQEGSINVRCLAAETSQLIESIFPHCNLQRLFSCWT